MQEFCKDQRPHLYVGTVVLGNVLRCSVAGHWQSLSLLPVRIRKRAYVCLSVCLSGRVGGAFLASGHMVGEPGEP